MVDDNFKRLLDAIPKAKKMGTIHDAIVVETHIKKMENMLKILRQYFMDTTGESSPFVKKIDEVLS